MPDADGFCPMADAFGNFEEWRRVMRAALIEKRQRPAEAPGPGRDAVVSITVPPTMLPGLIDALTKQQAKYEERYGKIYQEAGDAK